MANISSKEKVKNNLSNQIQGLRDYFSLMDELLDNISKPEPALAYCFQRIEMAQRAGLYALLMRNYRTNSELAWLAVDKIDITRSNFPNLYKEISGKEFDKNLKTVIEPAEKIRDNITHGRSQTSAQVHNAILKCLEYAKSVNDQFYKDAGFRPFGPLRGVTGSKGNPQLNKKISMAVLKGLGFLNGKNSQKSVDGAGA